MYIMIVAPPGGGKSTMYMGDPDYDIDGLDPRETIIFSAAGKPTHGRMAYAYTHRFLKGVNPNEINSEAKKPFTANYITFSSGHKSITRVVPLLKHVLKYGIKSGLDGKVYKVKNVIVDDFQNYINNAFYKAEDSTGYEKFNDVYILPQTILSYMQGYNNNEHTTKNLSEDKRVDFFVMMHVTKPDITADISSTNPIQLKIPGNMLKHAYPLEGEFNNILLIEDYQLYGQGDASRPFIRSEKGIIEEGSPADLALVKHNINKLYENSKSYKYKTKYK